MVFFVQWKGKLSSSTPRCMFVYNMGTF
jgi:hypothetical protein